MSAAKRETITINGNEKYKDTVVQLAAEHGFKITNPELQDRIEKAKAEIEAQRAIMREGVKEGRKEGPNSIPGTPIQLLTSRRGDADKEKTRDAPLSQTGPIPTAAERVIHLENIRERLDREAVRETAQARRFASILGRQGASSTNSTH